MNDSASSTSSTIQECPVCATTLPKALSPDAHSDRYGIDCERCGRFQITWELSVTARQTRGSSDWVRLSGIIRRATDLHTALREVLTTKNIEQVLISSGAPPDVNGQIDAILESIARYAPYYGDWTEWQPLQSWVARAFLPNGNNLVELCGIMEKRGLIDYGTRDAPNNIDVRFYMGLAGWERLRESRSVLRSSTQVFVAMWFHEDMKAIFDNGIAPAIDTCNLKPYRVDQKPADNRIDAEIIAQIRRSRCLIADVTGERPGVYYEAGYAQALGIPVIWSCNSSWNAHLPSLGAIRPVQQHAPECTTTLWKDRLHFDTRQFPHIFWDDESQLKTELISRIRMWGLDLPTKARDS